MKNLTIFLLFSAVATFAQPSTEIYLFDITKNAISNPRNVSNNVGYDNQPSFWPDGKSILYARNIAGQTDIARFYIDTQETELISKTPQGGEYSPLKMPGEEGISAIRLDTTGLQLLYRYVFNGDSEPLHPTLKIGYHAWLSNSEIVCFVLGEPATLQHVNIVTGTAKVLKENIGRSIHKMPKSDNISYIDKATTPNTIMQISVADGTTTKICDAVASSEDYCWLDKKNILMGQGNKLMKYSKKGGWQQVAELSTLGVKGSISRLAVSADGKKLAVVVAE